jgi:hypothetical protein
MAAKIGVAIVHGMGTFGVEKPETSAPSYSSALFENVRLRFGAAAFDQKVAWRESWYSGVFDANQERYRALTKSALDYGFLRDLAVTNLGDPASYHGGGGADPNAVYRAVHGQVSKAIARARKAAAGGPLVVVAHSLGGHVVSNLIYDLQINQPGAPGDIAAIVTLGCNLPLFLFGERPGDLKPIAFPGVSLPKAQQLRPWWRNYFDKNDPLGFPIAPSGGGYLAMKNSGALLDEEINVGGFFSSMTALSHVGYWADKDIAQRMVNLLRSLSA